MLQRERERSLGNIILGKSGKRRDKGISSGNRNNISNDTGKKMRALIL